MMPTIDDLSPAFFHRLLSRRATLRGLAAGGLARLVPETVRPDGIAAAVQDDEATPMVPPGPAVHLTDATLQAFEADIEQAMRDFRLVGAAVALMQDDRVLYSRGFGVRDLERNQPVTPHTRFRLGSMTKSMTSLLVATFVDDGLLAWDDRVVDIWPTFRTSDETLTQDLRVRDLLGMATGIGEAPTLEFFLSGGADSALDVLHLIPSLPIIAPPGTQYFYSNTPVAIAGYLGAVAQHMPMEDLETAYARLVQERIFTPIIMSAAIADDPRPLGDDYAIGYTRDLFERVAVVPFVSIGGAAPAGAGLASVTDLARYLITQMSGGVAPGGTRVVSAANLSETHRPGIVVPPDAPNALPSTLLTDTTEMHYCLGWFDQTFTDGRHLLHHGGGIDGFTSLMGFFPEEKIGFAILTNGEPGRGGGLFTFSVQSSLLSRLFGLNQDVPAFLASAVPILEGRTAELAARTRPVDPLAVAKYLGLYSDGFRLRLDNAGVLHLDHDIRSMPLLALEDGGYVVAAGPDVVLAKTVSFTDGPGGLPMMTIQGFEPVRWVTGG